MFKKPVGFAAVPHRLVGNHAAKDPLMNERIGASKRCREEDGTTCVEYKESPQERAARFKREEAEEKAARRAEKLAKKGGLPPPVTFAKPAGSVFVEKTNFHLKSKSDAKAALTTFKDRLKASTLPEDAAASETKHKEAEKAEIIMIDHVPAETEKAVAKLGVPAAAKSKPRAPPDSDPKLTMNDIWKASEADDDAEGSDWLKGGPGLKFHTTADKAFGMDHKKFKEAVEGHEHLENNEAGADLAKRKSELRMAEFRRGEKK